jgi:ferric-dicitrate binding protein FerR (iron transport regulator)
MFQFMLKEMREVQQRTCNRLEKISSEHEKATLHLKAQKQELEEREKQLQQREAQNETERRKLRKLRDEKIMVFKFIHIKIAILNSSAILS